MSGYKENFLNYLFVSQLFSLAYNELNKQNALPEELLKNLNALKPKSPPLLDAFELDPYIEKDPSFLLMKNKFNSIEPLLSEIFFKDLYKTKQLKRSINLILDNAKIPDCFSFSNIDPVLDQLDDVININIQAPIKGFKIGTDSILGDETKTIFNTLRSELNTFKRQTTFTQFTSMSHPFELFVESLILDFNRESGIFCSQITSSFSEDPEAHSTLISLFQKMINFQSLLSSFLPLLKEYSFMGIIGNVFNYTKQLVIEVAQKDMPIQLDKLMPIFHESYGFHKKIGPMIENLGTVTHNLKNVLSTLKHPYFNNHIYELNSTNEAMLNELDNLWPECKKHSQQIVCLFMQNINSMDASNNEFYKNLKSRNLEIFSPLSDFITINEVYSHGYLDELSLYMKDTQKTSSLTCSSILNRLIENKSINIDFLLSFITVAVNRGFDEFAIHLLHFLALYLDTYNFKETIYAIFDQCLKSNIPTLRHIVGKSLYLASIKQINELDTFTTKFKPSNFSDWNSIDFILFYFKSFKVQFLESSLLENSAFWYGLMPQEILSSELFICLSNLEISRNNIEAIYDSILKETELIYTKESVIYKQLLAVLLSRFGNPSQIYLQETVFKQLEIVKHSIFNTVNRLNRPSIANENLLLKQIWLNESLKEINENFYYFLPTDHSYFLVSCFEGELLDALISVCLTGIQLNTTEAWYLFSNISYFAHLFSKTEHVGEKILSLYKNDFDSKTSINTFITKFDNFKKHATLVEVTLCKYVLKGMQHQKSPECANSPIFKNLTTKDSYFVLFTHTIKELFEDITSLSTSSRMYLEKNALDVISHININKKTELLLFISNSLKTNSVFNDSQCLNLYFDLIQLPPTPSNQLACGILTLSIIAFSKNSLDSTLSYVLMNPHLDDVCLFNILSYLESQYLLPSLIDSIQNTSLVLHANLFLLNGVGRILSYCSKTKDYSKCLSLLNLISINFSAIFNRFNSTDESQKLLLESFFTSIHNVYLNIVDNAACDSKDFQRIHEVIGDLLDKLISNNIFALTVTTSSKNSFPPQSKLNKDFMFLKSIAEKDLTLENKNTKLLEIYLFFLESPILFIALKRTNPVVYFKISTLLLKVFINTSSNNKHNRIPFKHLQQWIKVNLKLSSEYEKIYTLLSHLLYNQSYEEALIEFNSLPKDSKLWLIQFLGDQPLYIKNLLLSEEQNSNDPITIETLKNLNFCIRYFCSTPQIASTARLDGYLWPLFELSEEIRYKSFRNFKIIKDFVQKFNTALVYGNESDAIYSQIISSFLLHKEEFLEKGALTEDSFILLETQNSELSLLALIEIFDALAEWFHYQYTDVYLLLSECLELLYESYFLMLFFTSNKLIKPTKDSNFFIAKRVLKQFLTTYSMLDNPLQNLLTKIYLSQPIYYKFCHYISSIFKSDIDNFKRILQYSRLFDYFDTSSDFFYLQAPLKFGLSFKDCYELCHLSKTEYIEKLITVSKPYACRAAFMIAPSNLDFLTSIHNNDLSIFNVILNTEFQSPSSIECKIIEFLTLCKNYHQLKDDSLIEEITFFLESLFDTEIALFRDLLSYSLSLYPNLILQKIFKSLKTLSENVINDMINSPNFYSWETVETFLLASFNQSLFIKCFKTYLKSDDPNLNEFHTHLLTCYTLINPKVKFPLANLNIFTYLLKECYKRNELDKLHSFFINSPQLLGAALKTIYNESSNINFVSSLYTSVINRTYEIKKENLTDLLKPMFNSNHDVSSILLSEILNNRLLFHRFTDRKIPLDSFYSFLIQSSYSPESTLSNLLELVNYEEKLLISTDVYNSLLLFLLEQCQEFNFSTLIEALSIYKKINVDVLSFYKKSISSSISNIDDHHHLISLSTINNAVFKFYLLESETLSSLFSLFKGGYLYKDSLLVSAINNTIDNFNLDESATFLRKFLPQQYFNSHEDFSYKLESFVTEINKNLKLSNSDLKQSLDACLAPLKNDDPIFREDNFILDHLINVLIKCDKSLIIDTSNSILSELSKETYSKIRVSGYLLKIETDISLRNVFLKNLSNETSPWESFFFNNLILNWESKSSYFDRLLNAVNEDEEKKFLTTYLFNVLETFKKGIIKQTKNHKFNFDAQFQTYSFFINYLSKSTINVATEIYANKLSNYFISNPTCSLNSIIDSKKINLENKISLLGPLLVLRHGYYAYDLILNLRNKDIFKYLWKYFIETTPDPILFSKIFVKSSPLYNFLNKLCFRLFTKADLLFIDLINFSTKPALIEILKTMTISTFINNKFNFESKNSQHVLLSILSSQKAAYHSNFYLFLSECLSSIYRSNSSITVGFFEVLRELPDVIQYDLISNIIIKAPQLFFNTKNEYSFKNHIIEFYALNVTKQDAFLDTLLESCNSKLENIHSIQPFLFSLPLGFLSYFLIDGRRSSEIKEFVLRILLQIDLPKKNLTHIKNLLKEIVSLYSFKSGKQIESPINTHIFETLYIAYASANSSVKPLISAALASLPIKSEMNSIYASSIQEKLAPYIKRKSLKYYHLLSLVNEGYDLFNILLTLKTERLQNKFQFASILQGLTSYFSSGLDQNKNSSSTTSDISFGSFISHLGVGNNIGFINQDLFKSYTIYQQKIIWTTLLETSVISDDGKLNNFDISVFLTQVTSELYIALNRHNADYALELKDTEFCERESKKFWLKIFNLIRFQSKFVTLSIRNIIIFIRWCDEFNVFLPFNVFNYISSISDFSTTLHPLTEIEQTTNSSILSFGLYSQKFTSFKPYLNSLPMQLDSNYFIKQGLSKSEYKSLIISLKDSGFLNSKRELIHCQYIHSHFLSLTEFTPERQIEIVNFLFQYIRKSHKSISQQLLLARYLNLIEYGNSVQFEYAFISLFSSIEAQYFNKIASICSRSMYIGDSLSQFICDRIKSLVNQRIDFDLISLRKITDIFRDKRKVMYQNEKLVLKNKDDLVDFIEKLTSIFA